ncbi:unnamed protein product [Caenorhabditis nigoni]
MNEPPTNPKFGLLKCPFALREQIVRNMEFMDAFYFSTLSKQSKRLVHDAKRRNHLITFRFDRLVANDTIIGLFSLIRISSEVLKFILGTIKTNEYYLGISIIEANFKYRKALDCGKLLTYHSVQWLDTDGILQRNLKMKKLHLHGKQINDLLKQWINGQVTDLESLIGYKRYNFPADVILDGIVTMEPSITHQQAKEVFSRQVVNGQLVNIQRKIDGQLATVLLKEEECFVIMWNENRLAELGN